MAPVTPFFAAQLTASDWITAGATALVTLLLAIMIRRITKRRIRKKDKHAELTDFGGRLLISLVLSAGAYYTLEALHVELGPALGAFGIGALVYRGRASTVVGQHRWVCGASSPAALPSRRSDPKQQLRRHGARYHLDVHGVAQLRRRVHPYSECTGPEPTTGQLDTRTGAAHDSADHGSLRM